MVGACPTFASMPLFQKGDGNCFSSCRTIRQGENGTRLAQLWNRRNYQAFRSLLSKHFLDALGGKAGRDAAGSPLYQDSTTGTIHYGRSENEIGKMGGHLERRV